MNVARAPEQALPGHSGPLTGPGGRIGALIVNLGTPEGTDYWSIRRYLGEFLSDRRVIETPRALWAPILQVILLRRPRVKGRDYEAIWNRERNEKSLKDDHPVAERAARPRSPRSQQRGRGRLGDALRRAADPRAPGGASSRGLRPHSRHSALSAILRRLDRNGRRQGVRGARLDALAAGGPDRRALLRRSRLYWRARPFAAREPWPSRLRTRSGARLLPRHSAGLRRQGRPLRPPVRGDDAAVAAGNGMGREAPADELPVAFRPGRVAEALYRGDGARTRFPRA